MRPDLGQEEGGWRPGQLRPRTAGCTAQCQPGWTTGPWHGERLTSLTRGPRPVPAPKAQERRLHTAHAAGRPIRSATPASSPRRGVRPSPQQPQTLLVSCLCVQGLTLCQADDTAASSSPTALLMRTLLLQGDPGQNHLPTQADGQPDSWDLSGPWLRVRGSPWPLAPSPTCPAALFVGRWPELPMPLRQNGWTLRRGRY